MKIKDFRNTLYDLSRCTAIRADVREQLADLAEEVGDYCDTALKLESMPADALDVGSVIRVGVQAVLEAHSFLTPARRVKES